MPKPIYKNLYNDFIWSKFNESKVDIVLYWSNGEEYRIPPGGRIILPKQREFIHWAHHSETVFFGGALGGSKSYAGRALMVECAVDYGRRRGQGMVEDKPPVVGIFCENYPALKDRHIEHVKSWPSWLGKYVNSEKEFRLKPEFGGGIIKFRNLDKPEKYASVEFAAVFIDELTFNSEKTFNDIVARVRWAGIPDTVIAAASNPGRVGHAWVKRRFVDEKTRAEGIRFIPSLLKDNPFLGLDPKYRKRLDSLPPKLKKAWIEGSWDVFEGQYFPELSEEIHFVAPFHIPAEWLRYRCIDHGYRHPTVCLWGAVDPEGNLYIYQEYSAIYRTADLHKRSIYDMSIRNGHPERYVATFGDPALKRVDGSAIGNKTPYEVYNDPNDGMGSFYVVEALRDRVEGWQALQQAFHYEIDSDASEKDGSMVFKTHPKIKIFNTCQNLWYSLSNLVYDDKQIEDAKKTKNEYGPGEGDDEAETLRYLWTMAGKTDLNTVYVQRNEDFNRSMGFSEPTSTSAIRERILRGTFF